MRPYAGQALFAKTLCKLEGRGAKILSQNKVNILSLKKKKEKR